MKNKCTQIAKWAFENKKFSPPKTFWKVKSYYFQKGYSLQESRTIAQSYVSLQNGESAN